MKRIVSIWLPYFTIDRLTKFSLDKTRGRYAQWSEKPFAIIQYYKTKAYIVSFNIKALNMGVRLGMTREDAYAVCSILKLVEIDSEEDRSCLLRLVEIFNKYTPLVSVESISAQGAADVWLDISGCSHLFGGEYNLLIDLSKSLSVIGMTSQIGLGDTPSISWAIAHYLADPCSPKIMTQAYKNHALLNLPIESLRLTHNSINELKKIGIVNVKELLALPHSALRVRIGEAVITRINQFLGTVNEPIGFDFSKKQYCSKVEFFEPINTLEELENSLAELLGELCTKLKFDCMGLQKLALEVFCINNTKKKITIGTKCVTTDYSILFALFREKIAYFKFDSYVQSMLLTAMSLGVSYNTQKNLLVDASVLDSLSGTNKKSGLSLGSDFFQLIDKLNRRLGKENITNINYVPNHLPERATVLVPVLDGRYKTPKGNANSSTKIHKKVPMCFYDRPIYLFKSPEKLNLFVDCRAMPELLLPPLLMFEWRRKKYCIIGAEGPEIISQPWWNGSSLRNKKDNEESAAKYYKFNTQSRAYWKVENYDGMRLWVFCFPFISRTYNISELKNWFVHGLFP